ncbi:MAG: hypothetical protein JWO31_720 [Phycisphaerales bacterium]|nr:hypothetical protein [Phycisphaerales bacterium]
MLVLLAQATVPSGESIPGWQQAGIVAASIGLVGYLVKFVIPKMLADYRVEMQTERDSHAANVAKVSDTFAAEMRAQREAFDRSNDRQMRWLEMAARLPTGPTDPAK